MSSQAISSSSAHSPVLPSDGFSPASFRSVLFAGSEIAFNLDEQKAPDIFTDLNLDQVVESVAAGRKEYNLNPFFYMPLRDVDSVNYRHEVFRDLEDSTLAGFFHAFAQEMWKMRATLAQADKLYYKRQKQSWFLDAVQIYCEAASHLSYHLMHTRIGSRGLRALRSYLVAYVDSNEFRGLVTDQSKEVYGRETFDLALAAKLNRERSAVVRNDFYLHDPERIFVVSGPNQGGKTTFARTFGQLHYLASVGCPVPGAEARLFLCDGIFTHFEREEDIQNLSGKLEEELRRIHHILKSVTPNSILIMNESFLATTVNDALFLSKEIMRRIVDLDFLCVSVTFLDELAAFSETTVSMVSGVKPEDPALRTFKLARKPADGLAYAAAIAEKYRLTHDAVKARIAVNVKGHVTR